MHTYKTKPDGFRQIRRTMIFRDFPLFLLTISLGGLMIAFEKPERPINWYLLGTIILILAVIFAFAFPQIITNRRHIYEDFLLTIDEDGITREQYHADPLTIAKDEVSKIYKTSNGGLVIKGVPGSETIIIPPKMEESEKLEHELAGIKSFSQMPFLEKYWLLSGLTVFSLLAVIYLVTDKWLVGISGLILLGLYGYTFYSTNRHKNITDILKSSIFPASYLVFIIVRKMYSTITGG